jgi:hypothetical protein
MKQNKQAVAEFRARAARMGLKRLELYAHPMDWTEIRKHAARLQRRRERLALNVPKSTTKEIEI